VLVGDGLDLVVEKQYFRIALRLISATQICIRVKAIVVPLGKEIPYPKASVYF
jgi:hypothetical protein